MMPKSLVKSRGPDGDPVTLALRAKVKTIVVIYAENRAFDNLYGNFPGARGLGDVVDASGQPLPAYAPQRDRDGSVLRKLPPPRGGVTAPGYKPVVTQAQSAGLPNAPFSIDHAFTPQSKVTLSTVTVTRDLYHRFHEHQMQIDGGRNDGYAAWSDAGGLAMGHYDYSGSALFALARKYVRADHFFQGAFGGSFLNHQYLVCACAPEYPNADTSPAKPTVTGLETGADGRDDAPAAECRDHRGPHHQPFNYYTRFDPRLHSDERIQHLKDYDGLIADVVAGNLPEVVFYKPQGNLNQHAGYASVADGDASIADLVAKLQAGPQWNNMVIVVTYDEYGGGWDHVAPPRRGLIGPGAHPGSHHFTARPNEHRGSHPVRHRVGAAIDDAPFRPRTTARHGGPGPRTEGAC